MQLGRKMAASRRSVAKTLNCLGYHPLSDVMCDDERESMYQLLADCFAGDSASNSKYIHNYDDAIDYHSIMNTQTKKWMTVWKVNHMYYSIPCNILASVVCRRSGHHCTGVFPVMELSSMSFFEESSRSDAKEEVEISVKS